MTSDPRESGGIIHYSQGNGRKAHVEFDNKLSIGNIITIAVVILGLLTALRRSDLSEIREQLRQQKEMFTEVTESNQKTLQLMKDKFEVLTSKEIEYEYRLRQLEKACR